MIRAKTKRRLVLLLVVAVGGAAALGGAYAARRYYQRSQAQQAGQKGIAAAKAGNYEAALSPLNQYLRRFPNDPDAVYQFAHSLQMVGDIGDAVTQWRRYLDLKPDDLEARRQLLELYVETGYSNETLDSADIVLRGAPDDPVALRDKAIGLLRLRRFPESLTTIQHLNQLHPDDFENQMLALDIQKSNGATPAQLVKVADDLSKAHPNDVHFALLQSITRANAGDTAGAAAVIRDSIANPPADPKTVDALVHQLDALGLYSDAISVAQKSFDQHRDVVEFRRILASRLLVAGNQAQFDFLLKDIAPDQASADGQLLALKGISSALGKDLAQAGKCFDAVTGRQNAGSDHVAVALATAGHALWLDTGDIKSRVDACSQAIFADKQNPFLHLILAQACELKQDADASLREWQNTHALAPAWGTPLTHSARILLNAGRTQDALALAREAQKRTPDDQDTLLVIAAAWSSTLNITQTAEAEKLLAFLQDVQKRFPSAEQVRPLLINLLAHLGTTDDTKKAYQAQARKEFQAALDLNPPPSETTLLQLVTVSRINKMQLESDCFARSEKAHGMTPQLAFSKAVWMLGSGQSKEGLAFFESAMPKQDADSAWQTFDARYLELLNDPRAKSAWIKVADAFPKDTQIQWAAFAAPSVQDDDAFLDRTIKRLRDELGQNDIGGRFAQALLLLHGKPTDKQISEAAVLLSDITRSAPNLVQARVLLANCLRQMGNISGAVDQYRAAAQASPEDASIALNLASLFISQGETDNARDQLKRLAQLSLSPGQRYQAATLYRSLGDDPNAASFLEKNGDLRSSLDLVQLYLRQNQTAKAEELCRKLYETPPLSAPVIQLYANILAAQGHKPEAEAVLVKLDATDAKTSVKELVRGDYQEHFGKPEDALVHFLAAAKADSKDEYPWRQLLLFCLRTNRMDDAAKYVMDAHAQVPSQAGFAAVAEHLSQLRQLADEPAAKGLFVSLLQTPQASADVASLLEAIQLASAAKSQTLPAPQLAPKIRQLADKNPKILAVQLYAAEYQSSIGQNDDAVTIVMRAVQGFPNSPEATQIATAILAVAGRWNEVITVANQWRQRDPGQALQADAAIAAANMQLGNLKAGMDELAPYLDRALKAPDDYPNIIVLYAQDLIATKQLDKATQLLAPLLTTAKWRLLGLRLAGSIADPASQTAWLDRVGTAIPPGNVSERVQLAYEYEALALKSNNADLTQKARAILEPLTARTDVESSVLTAMASLYEKQRDFTTAEQLYRRALKADPNQAAALNNLAMILANSDRNLSEAFDLASKAAALAPVASVYDTLASVQAHQKNYVGALASIDQALKLDPKNPDWHASRVWTLALSGKQDAAMAEFQAMKAANEISRLSPESSLRLTGVGLK